MKSTDVCSANDDDRITNLPEDVTSHILFHLPTIYAVSTSVLSKEWEYKWASVFSIDICDEKPGIPSLGNEGETSFIRFMERIISVTRNVRNVRLRICKKYDFSVINSWISALLGNQIEVLDVSTLFNSMHVVIPSSLLSSTSLREMKLKGHVFSLPSSNCFANLRSLRLENVLIRNEDSDNDTLVFKFPVLEKLEVSYCTWSGVKVVEIYAPALVTFVSEKTGSPFGKVVNQCTITIHGGKLTQFISRGDEPDDIYVTGSKVVSAMFLNRLDEDFEAVMRWSGSKIQRLLKEFSYSLEHLMLSFCVAEAIMASMQGVPLTSCAKLSRLVLGNIDYPTSGKTEVLLELLDTMPSLKCLHLHMAMWTDFNYDAVETMDYIPSCVTSSLEKIEFDDIYANATVAHLRPQLRLAKFFLKNALNLKEFHVYADENKELEDEIVSELSAYPTGSRCVKIVGLQQN